MFSRPRLVELECIGSDLSSRFYAETFGCANAFPRGEGGTAPAPKCYCGSYVLTYYKRKNHRKPCGAVTEEGKRSVSWIGRTARGQVRLPSSVTLPPKFGRIQNSFISNRLRNDYRYHRQCATFSSGEGFGVASDVVLLWKVKRIISWIISRKRKKRFSVFYL